MIHVVLLTRKFHKLFDKIAYLYFCFLPFSLESASGVVKGVVPHGQRQASPAIEDPAKQTQDSESEKDE